MTPADEARAQTFAKIAGQDAQLALGIPKRILTAWRQTDPETILTPLRASGGTGTSGSGTSDPTGDTACNGYPTPDPADLRNARRRIERLILDRERLLEDLLRELNRWAPNPPDTKGLAAANDTADWCTNHRRHGVQMPVTARGGRNGTYGRDGLCGWCREIETDWGVLPNHVLIRMRERGQRIPDVIYARELGVTSRPVRTGTVAERRVLKPGDDWA